MNESLSHEQWHEIRVLLNTLARHHNLLQWVDCWAVGRNEGGLYVSLFYSKAQYRLCTVYAERFRELPAFIRDQIPEDAIEISTDRNVVERKGQLRKCTPFLIARYTVGDGDKAAWRFGGVVRVSKPGPTQNGNGSKPAPQPAPQKPAPVPDVNFYLEDDNPFEDDSAHKKLAIAGRTAFGSEWDAMRPWLVRKFTQRHTPNDVRTNADDLSEAEAMMLCDAIALHMDAYKEAWKKLHAGIPT